MWKRLNRSGHLKSHQRFVYGIDQLIIPPLLIYLHAVPKLMLFTKKKNNEVPFTVIVGKNNESIRISVEYLSQTPIIIVKFS